MAGFTLSDLVLAYFFPRPRGMTQHSGGNAVTTTSIFWRSLRIRVLDGTVAVLPVSTVHPRLSPVSLRH
jgi:hypothetical protein